MQAVESCSLHAGLYNHVLFLCPGFSLAAHREHNRLICLFLVYRRCRKLRWRLTALWYGSIEGDGTDAEVSVALFDDLVEYIARKYSIGIVGVPAETCIGYLPNTCQKH